MDDNFNNNERVIANLLTKYPYIKKMTKLLYSHCSYFFKRKKKLFYTDNELIKIGTDTEESFFGYYDKRPSYDGEYILSHLSSRKTTKKPNKESKIKIALFSSKNISKPILVINSKAYNWQQGSRLQWLNRELFIFNDFCKKKQKYISRVYSNETLCEVKQFELPVQDSYKTDYFLSLNYQRLQTLRPDYGYRNLPVLSQKELLDNDNDGIWFVDFENGESKLLYNLYRIISLRYKKVFSNSIHKINHLMISPSGKYFIFLHRYYLGKQKFDRLILADNTGSNLKILSDNGMVSHCNWINDNKIIGYMRGKGNVDGYYIIDIAKNITKRLTNVELNLFGDGHPDVYGDWIVTDSYPDKARMRHLLLFNIKTNELRKIGSFFQSFSYAGETRCDLHPRFSYDGRSVFFDSVFSGKRHLYQMKINLD